jgi:hypothetical protein
MKWASNELLIGIMLMAIGASAKSVVDVAVLKAENRNIKSLVLEIRQDIKDIHKTIHN